MANEVFANGREISCKKADGKSICAFPDVCFTPPDKVPPTPPGIPIPYPNTGMATDTTSGSKKVQISGKEINLKNKSYFKKSTGDEAGCAQKKGVITSKNTGKVYFTAWSMDVKVEGENVVRHLDLTTHNHASMPGNTPPWPYLDSMSVDQVAKCSADQEKEKEACGHDAKTGDYAMSPEEACESEECQGARKCMLVPYGGGGSPNCCPGVTGHHLIEDHWVQGQPGFEQAHGSSGHGAAPTVCAEGSRYDSEHGTMHAIQGVYEDSYLPEGVNGRQGKTWDYDAGKKAALRAHHVAFFGRCAGPCIEAQLDEFYGDDGDRPLRQSKQRQPIGEAREQGEVLVDNYFGGVGNG